MMLRNVLFCALIALCLAACGKKPAQLQPLVAPLGADPAYYPYPKIQPPPPVPASPSSP